MSDSETLSGSLPPPLGSESAVREEDHESPNSTVTDSAPIPTWLENTPDPFLDTAIHQSETIEFGNEGAAEDPTQRLRGLAPATPPGGLPSRLGRYRLVSSLAEGGFGVVYLAHDDDLDRAVAIKVPSSGAFASPRHLELFLKEARLAAALKHPAIVMVYDVGRATDGLVYVVLEYIQGHTLSHYLQTETAPHLHLIGILIEVAEAAHHAHQHELVHRDLKPSNILIDREGKPHITDFGLAVREDGRRLWAREIAGTREYMAPEQVRGETHRIDARTDIWALGIVLYMMLTGRRPFAGSAAEIFDQILHREPLPPRKQTSGVRESSSGSA